MVGVVFQLFFFFQAEDGIRDTSVTGVQTCALPISYFTDRDGKYQLASFAESGFDPLSRTCRFMLTEEAHHMFVGETGVGRVVQRTCERSEERRVGKECRCRW